MSTPLGAQGFPAPPDQPPVLGHRARMRRARQLAWVALSALEDDQVEELTQRLVRRMRLLSPFGPSYARFRACVAELCTPMTGPLVDRLARDPRFGRDTAARLVRRGLMRAIDTYPAGCATTFRHHALTTITVALNAAEADLPAPPE